MNRFCILFTFYVAAAVSAQHELAPPILTPEDFSGCVGFYQVSAEAVPTKLAVEDPLVLTVRIRGQGPKSYQPQRSKLRILPSELENDFFVAPLPQRDRYDKSMQSWDFSWELRPKRSDVNVIPSLRFVYYSTQKMFQSAYTDAIFLTVSRRPEAKIDAPSAVLPATLLQIDVSAAALRRVPRFVSPAWWQFVVALLTPPAVCAGCCWIYRRSRTAPDVRSRAAKAVLRRLSDGVDAAAAEQLLTEYLQQRFGMAVNDPTPQEVEDFLRRTGMPCKLRQRWQDLYARCSSCRFTPGLAPANGDLADETRQIVLLTENATRTAKPNRWLGCLLLFALVPVLAVADSTGKNDAKLLAQAVHDFQQKAFCQAAARFEQLRQHGVNNAEHYLNQGNAEALCGRLPAAILSYRRGLQLEPAHATLRANLELARDRVVHDNDLTRPPMLNWPPWMPAPHMNVLLVAALLLYSCGWGSLAVWWCTGRGTAMLAATLCLTAALAVAALHGVRHWQMHLAENVPIVVIASETAPLRQGNGRSYPPHAEVPQLRRGMEARRLFERGNWLQIQFASGIIGWIDNNDVFVDRSVRPQRP